jgi:hypothetical protein
MYETYPLGGTPESVAVHVFGSPSFTSPHGRVTSNNVLIAHGTPLDRSGREVEDAKGFGMTIEFDGSEDSPYP